MKDRSFFNKLFFHENGEFSSMKFILFQFSFILWLTTVAWIASVIFDFQIDPNWYVLVGSLFGTGIIGRAGQMAAPYVLGAFKTRGERKAEVDSGKKAPPPKPQKQNVVVGDNKLPSSKNFKIDEFHCKDGTPVPEQYYKNVQDVMDSLEVVREAFGGKRITISSGYRTVSYNKAIGGAKLSKHLQAMAVDFKVFNTKASQVQKKVEELMDEGKIKAGGIGLGKSFTHYDIRGKKTKWTD